MFFAHALRVLIFGILLGLIIFIGKRLGNESDYDRPNFDYAAFLLSGLALVALIPKLGEKLVSPICKLADIIAVDPLEGSTPLEKLFAIPLVKSAAKGGAAVFWICIAVITVSYILFVLFSGKKLPAFFVFPIVSVLAAVFFMQSVNGIPPFIISVVLGIVFAFVFNALIPYRD